MGVLTTLANPAASNTQIAAAAGGSLFSGLGGYIQARGFAQQNAASAEAARRAADEAPKKAAWQETRLRMVKRATLSSQRFMAARAGIQIEGTPTDVMLMTEREMELDAMGIYREGQMERLEFLEQEKAYKAAERANKKSGMMSMLGAFF